LASLYQILLTTHSQDTFSQEKSLVAKALD